MRWPSSPLWSNGAFVRLWTGRTISIFGSLITRLALPFVAILVLQATFVDEDRAAGFWQAAAGLMEKLSTSPGLIRRYNFTDGPHYTLFAFWRTPAHAHAFFASDEHKTAMRDLFEHRWQYSHFAGLWECATPRQRVIFCQDCDAVAPATAGTCSGCGAVLVDPYRTAKHVGR